MCDPRKFALQEQRHGLVFFACYMCAIFTMGLLIAIPSVERATHQLIGQRAWLFVILRNPVPFLGLVAIVGYCVDRERRRALLRVFGPLNTKVLAAFTVASFGSVVLVLLGLWPWEFNRPGSDVGDLTAAFVRSHLWLPIALHVISAAIVVPVCEEIAFRFGLLQTLLARGLSRGTALVLSSVVFGLAHWGALNVLEPWALRRVLFATLLGLVGGYLTLRDGGSVGRAIAIHAARNGMEAAFLVVTVVAYVRAQG